MKLLLSLLLVGAALAAPELGKLSPMLQQALRSRQEETFNIFVTFTEDTSSVLEQVEMTTYSDRAAKTTAMRSLLLELADKSQVNAIQTAAARGFEHTVFWISNQLFVKAANFDLIRELAALDEVEAIDEEQFAYLEEPISSRNATPAADYEWGILKIKAPEAWEALGNNNGRGVVVATVDTGVRVTHEALKENFYGTYGWFDPSTSEPEPTDRNGHGTHTTGTIAGKAPIGVAPGAKWMACRGCATSACSQYDLNMCGQFFACPTLADGTAADCSKAPHIVSNSWGGGRGTTWFSPVIDAWRVAKIIPVFSNGNSGPNCNTANSPADNAKVIGVGSTMESDSISSFSSVGPTLDGRMKPEISAPGSDVVSAYHTGDDVYRSLSGTSMACPHVAGTLALLLTRTQDVSYEKALELLQGSTDRTLAFSGRVCEEIPDNRFPNHVFGHGRLNALKAVNAQTKTLHQ